MEQAEIIADFCSRISNSYAPIDQEKISMSPGNKKSTPKKLRSNPSILIKNAGGESLTEKRD